MKKIVILFFVVLLTFCTKNNIKVDDTSYKKNDGFSYKEILLPAVNRSTDFEYSSLTIYNNKLILMPQYLYSKEDNSTGYLFSIELDVLRNRISNNNFDEPVKLDSIKINLKGLEKFNSSGSGFEAIGFSGNQVFFTIEDFGGFSGETVAYFVEGKINNEKNFIQLDTTTLVQIPNKNSIENLSYESLVYQNGKINFIYEANGQNISERKICYEYDLSTKIFSEVQFPFIEYRITDLTNMVGNQFYALNYFWPGELEVLSPSVDSIALKFGRPVESNFQNGIERILRFIKKENKIELDTTFAPIYLVSKPIESHNWEGLAFVKDLGYFFITDTHPRTILGFLSNQN